MNYLEKLRATMTDEKKESAKKDIFAFYIGRPLSYILTVPFLWLNVTPNFISVIAFIEIILAGTILAVANTLPVALIGWFLFFLWNLLDGVDGNIARLKKNGSPIGSVYDAMSGYAAMFLLYFSAGIWASKVSVMGSLLIIIGSISGMSVLFPRLVMHKAATAVQKNNLNSELADRSDFGIVKSIVLNFTSISGLVQPILLIAIVTNKVVMFTVVYLIINVTVMLGSLYKILK
ncbi:CDP-alcohol phosphatidyltransferase family protein [Lactiplantibacillus pentosus]|uniref:Putative ribitol phosphotransferase n=1 Tax=Lactiplantibacillus paraplantarum TaxID=60520 RepID=T2KH22_9LACO|nr:CDP-alcohol phosphatidyltransferase family protein [Lactiplantibacillus pentosus]CDF77683.1 putative ribitol phosphotransferase [Lactiplantibacillus paraplantarum]